MSTLLIFGYNVSLSRKISVGSGLLHTKFIADSNIDCCWHLEEEPVKTAVV